MLNPDTVIGDRYIVKRKLAEGGMAEIYLCTAMGPEGFEKEVVIKRIRSFWSDDDMFIQMFIAEARLASRLNHANIVQIFHFDKHEDTYYLAMEYVNGPSLRDFLRKTKEKTKPLPILLACDIAANIARGLHYAHNRNIVHRDVSPHNILLSFDGGIKLADFGIAKTSTQHTSPGVLKGKFAYMSPEQARGEAVDARTDIFALGIVLWEALTRSRLFEYDSYVNAIQALQENLIVQPSRFNPEVPEPLDHIVLKALNRSPAERYQSAQEFERALINFILSHARSADDTHLSHFLQTVYGDVTATPPEKKEPSVRTHTPSSRPSSPSGPRPSSPSAPSGPRLSAPSGLSRPSLPSAPSGLSRPSLPSLPPAPSGPSRPSLPKLPSAPPVVTKQEFAPQPEPLAPPKPPKSFTNFLRNPVAIGLALVVGAGVGVYGTLYFSSTGQPGQGLPKPVEPPPVEPKPAELPPVEPKPVELPPVEPKPVEPPPVEPKPVEPPPPPLARITIDARPWAIVTINHGKPMEVAGRKTFRLPAGTHKIKFSFPEKEEERTLRIKNSDDHQTIKFNAASP